jgi:hypothetical protein
MLTIFTILFTAASIMTAFTLFILLKLLYEKPTKGGTTATAEEIDQLLKEGGESFAATIGGLHSCRN